MNTPKILSFAIVAIVTVVSARPALAYTLLSPTRRWATTPVAVRVYNAGNATITLPDTNGGVTAVYNAIKVWNIVDSQITGSPAVTGSAPATITLNSNGGGLCTGNCLAATLTGYYSGSTITDADIYTNTSQPFFSSYEMFCGGEFDIDGVMAHEVGHVLGIGHSTDPTATMRPGVAACDTSLRSLAWDDLFARIALYGQ